MLLQGRSGNSRTGYMINVLGSRTGWVYCLWFSTPEPCFKFKMPVAHARLVQVESPSPGGYSHLSNSFISFIHFLVVFKIDKTVNNVSFVDVRIISVMLLLRKAYRCHSKIGLSHPRNGDRNEGEYFHYLWKYQPKYLLI